LSFSSASSQVKAWVNFNGTGTVAIRASLNVSSITDEGTGLFTVNFTTALSDANYAVCMTGKPSSDSPALVYIPADSLLATYSTTGVGVRSGGTSSAGDCPITNVVVFR
jgi:hypothetical protein